MDPLDDEALPRGIALAWGVSANPQRGPRRELTIERIVETAVELADRDGLSAVSMSSVATALGFTTMSLYRYVSAKDDLLLLMQEEGMGMPPLAIEDAVGWREGLIRWYRASLAVYAAHPWLLDIPIASAPNTPNNLAWLDAALHALRDTSLDARSRVSAVTLLNGQSRWEAFIARGLSAVQPLSDSTIASLVTADQFPDLQPILAAGGFASHDNPFEYGLALILDGLEHDIAGLAPHGVRPSDLRVEDHGDVARDEGVKKWRQAVKDAEAKLRDVRRKETEAVAKARERAAKKAAARL